MKYIIYNQVSFFEKHKILYTKYFPLLQYVYLIQNRILDDFDSWNYTSRKNEFDGLACGELSETRKKGGAYCVEINSEDTELLPLYDHLIRKTATLNFSQLFNKEKLL